MFDFIGGVVVCSVFWSSDRRRGLDFLWYYRGLFRNHDVWCMWTRINSGWNNSISEYIGIALLRWRDVTIMPCSICTFLGSPVIWMEINTCWFNARAFLFFLIIPFCAFARSKEEEKKKNDHVVTKNEIALLDYSYTAAFFNNNNWYTDAWLFLYTK